MISFHEIFDMVFMTIYLGVLFSAIFGRSLLKRKYEPLEKQKTFMGIDLRLFGFSVLLIAPAIILHELAHKFVAMGFGLDAVFHAFYANKFTLILGIAALFMALLNFGFVFLVPGFVSISPGATPLVTALIAFAGPFMNLLLFFAALIVLKTHKHLSKKAFTFWQLTKLINIFLFIFNMLPIPGFDGSKVLGGLLQAIF